MRKNAAFLGLAVGLFLLIPAASPSTIATLSVERLDLVRGSAFATSRGISFEPGISISTEGFQLVAEKIDGFVDVFRSDVVVGGASVDDGTSMMEEVHASLVTSKSFSSDDDVRLLIIPWGDQISNITGSKWTGPMQVETADRLFRARATFSFPDVVVPSKNSISAGIADGEVVLSGSFRLVLWSATLVLEAANRTTTIETGLQAETIFPSPTGGRGVERTQEREAYLNITNGQLRVSAETGMTVFMAFLQASAGNGSLLLQDATGRLTLGDDRELAGSDLLTTGDVTFEARPASGRLEGELEGNPTTLVVDGTRVDLPRPDVGIPQWVWAVAWFLGLALLFGAYRAEAALGLRRLERLMAGRDYGRAERSASRLKWLPRVSEDALVAQAVCLVRLDRPSEAKALLERKPWGRDAVRPARLFLRARIAAGEGDDEEARQLLADCVALAPQFILDAQADPVLRPFVQRLQSNGGYA